MLVVLVGKVDLGRGKAVLLANAGLGMVRLTEDDKGIVGLEMGCGFLTSLGSGLGWSGGRVCLGFSVASMTEFSETTLAEEVVCDPDTLFGAPGFILANTAESNWPLIALFKAAAFLVSTAGGGGACFVVEALSVFAPRWTRSAGGNAVARDGVAMDKLAGWPVGLSRLASLTEVVSCSTGALSMGDGGRLRHGEPTSARIEAK